MEFGSREILILLGVIILLGILLDGFRRVRHIRSRSLKVSRRRPAVFDDEGYDELPGELPTGEVRVTVRDDKSAEEVSDNIRKFRERNNGKCTSAFLNTNRETPEREDFAPAAERPRFVVEEVDSASDDQETTEPDGTWEQPASLDAFAIDETAEQATHQEPDHEPRIEPTWTLDREEPVTPNEKPFRVEREDRRAGKPFWEETQTRGEREPQGAEPAFEEPPKAAPSESVPESRSDGARASSGDLEVIVLHLMAKKDGVFEGENLLEALLANGLRYGDMGIFHRHENDDGSGPVHFSIANSVKPGTFDLDAMDEFSTPGVTFFMALNQLNNPLDSYNRLIKTAQALAKALQGELKDENRSDLTKQTLEHYRQQIIEYTRRSFTLSH